MKAFKRVLAVAVYDCPLHLAKGSRAVADRYKASCFHDALVKRLEAKQHMSFATPDVNGPKQIVSLK